MGDPGYIPTMSAFVLTEGLIKDTSIISSKCLCTSGILLNMHAYFYNKLKDWINVLTPIAIKILSDMEVVMWCDGR